MSHPFFEVKVTLETLREIASHRDFVPAWKFAEEYSPDQAGAIGKLVFTCEEGGWDEAARIHDAVVHTASQRRLDDLPWMRRRP